jgi:succinate dehydrogenase / fumarate reductase cytochrome b subunit
VSPPILPTADDIGLPTEPSAATATTLRFNVRPTSRDTRPVNLDLGTIDLPVTAYASITHRVTGVLMFFASFLMLWALDQSLASEASFNAVAAVLSSPLAKVVSWGIASVLTYHALAGIKHLIMDAGIGETMRGGVLGARIVFLLAAAAAALWGVLIW